MSVPFRLLDQTLLISLIYTYVEFPIHLIMFVTLVQALPLRGDTRFHTRMKLETNLQLCIIFDMFLDRTDSELNGTKH
jgi:hypothetical protein